MNEPDFQARVIRSASRLCSAIASSAVSRKLKKLPAILPPWTRLLPARATTSAITAPKLAKTFTPILMLPNQAKADLRAPGLAGDGLANDGPAGVVAGLAGACMIVGSLELRSTA